MNQVKIGEYIALKRKTLTLTQEQLAEALGVSPKTISKWETGRSLPDYTLVKPLCEKLGVSVTELFDGQDAGTSEVTLDETTLIDLLRRTQDLETQKNLLYGIVVIVLGLALLSLSFVINGSDIRDFIGGACLGISIPTMLIGVYLTAKSWRKVDLTGK